MNNLKALCQRWLLFNFHQSVSVLQFNPINRPNVGSCSSTSGEMSATAAAAAAKALMAPPRRERRVQGHRWLHPSRIYEIERGGGSVAGNLESGNTGHAGDGK